MSTRLDYVKYDEETIKLQNKFKILFYELEDLLGSELGRNRETSIAITKLEESWMWVGKSLKILQENKNEPCREQHDDAPLDCEKKKELKKLGLQVIEEE